MAIETRPVQRFKQNTLGHCLLMGRKTWDSIGRPLPGRQTIVLSRQTGLLLPAGVVQAHCIDDVLPRVEPGREVMVVGGAQVYQLALPRCQRMRLTRVMTDIEGDTIFPAIDWSQWRQVSSELVEADADNQWPCDYQLWERLDACHS